MEIRASIYCRISSDVTGLAAGVERQEADCREYCAKAGWSVAEVYVDNDISAFSGKARPAYRRMLAAVAARQTEAIVAWHLDRLYRRIPDLSELIDVCGAAGLTHIKTLSGDIDLTTADGRLHAYIMGSVAQHESDHKAERQRRQILASAREGRPKYGGRRGYGYDSTGRNIMLPEAAIIREAAERVMAGESLRQVRLDLNRRGVPTASGRAHWDSTGLRRVLISPRIAGIRMLNGVEMGEGGWPAIITRETHEMLVSIIDGRQPDAPTGRAYSYLLTGGIARCALCGTKLVSGKNNDSRSYGCRRDDGGCGGISIKAEHLESYVRDYVLEALAGDYSAAPEGGVDPDTVRRLAGYRERLAQLTQDYSVEGLFDKQTYLSLQRTLHGKIEVLEREVAAAPMRPERWAHLTSTALAGAWESMPVDNRREIVRGVVASVTVAKAGPGYGFRPERVTILPISLANAGIEAPDLENLIHKM